jgi:glutamate/tyrosine decarboxylase-like PLP-dependent enzyme
VTDVRALLHHTADHAAGFLESLDDRPVGATAGYAQMLEAFGGGVPDEGRPATEVIDDLVQRATPGLEGMPSARYFGFVIGGHLDAALAADNLTAAWDQNTTLAASTPAAAACEDVVGQQLANVLGLPSGTSFALVTGGMMANFTALAAARHSVLRAHGWDHERDGLQGAPHVRLVVGEERHSTIDRSLRYLGFGASCLEIVDSDGQGAMRPDALARVLGASAKGPTIVCAQAGNVNSGAFDPFVPICDIAHEHGAWVHIDGAFGLWVAASRNHRHLLDGYERADSWATDAHKWLNVPYDCGVALTAHPSDHAGAFGFRAEYLVFSDGMRDPADFTPEASRRARAFAVWAALQSLGRAGVADLVDRCCERAGQFADALRAVPGVEVANDVVINQIVVRFPGVAPGDVLEAVKATGACVMTPTTWKGSPGMRISVSNWQTTERDIEISVDAVRGAVAEVRARV